MITWIYAGGIYSVIQHKSDAQMSQPNFMEYFQNRSFQDYLYLGYAYLLMLGIASDSIFYGFFGINILEYSNVLDVLLSPIIYVTKGGFFSLTIAISPIFVYLFGLVLKRRQEKAIKAGNPPEKPFSLQLFVVIISAVMIFSAYMGYGFGRGQKIKSMVQEKRFKADYTFEFSDGEEINVKLIGHNSEFAFYVLEDSSTINISPIRSNIRRMIKME